MKKRKVKTSRKHCNIKHCKRSIVACWSPKDHVDKSIKVCAYHLDKHHDPNDTFNLWNVLKLTKPKSMKEDLIDAGVQVTTASCGGIKIKCSHCGYTGELLVKTKNVKCPNCNQYLDLERRTKMKKTKKKTKTKARKAKTKAKASTKRRSLVREVTEYIARTGADKADFKKCRKLAREIKPDTSFNKVYFNILVSKVRSQAKEASASSKKKKKKTRVKKKIRRRTK